MADNIIPETLEPSQNAQGFFYWENLIMINPDIAKIATYQSSSTKLAIYNTFNQNAIFTSTITKNNGRDVYSISSIAF